MSVNNNEVTMPISLLNNDRVTIPIQLYRNYSNSFSTCWKYRRDHKTTFHDIKITAQDNDFVFNNIDIGGTVIYWEEYYGFTDYDYLEPDNLKNTTMCATPIKNYKLYNNNGSIADLSYIKKAGSIRFTKANFLDSVRHLML